MDFTTTIYDSTVHDNYYAPADAGSPIPATQLNGFINQLLSTIDIDTLAAVYFRQLSQITGVAGLCITEYARQLVFGDLSRDRNIGIDLPLVGSLSGLPDQPKSVFYTFAKEPGPTVRARLAQLHQLFTPQLRHAVEYARLRTLATKDSLTGLGNRNGFNDAYSRLICRAQRHMQSFGLLVIDLDNFKAINDSLGHRVGDSVLMDVASQISQSLRGEDEAFRFGGDEFCCLLDCQSGEHLKAAAIRLRTRIRSSALLSRHTVTVSVGGANYRDSDDKNALFDRADNALYKAKAGGKNAYQAA